MRWAASRRPPSCCSRAGSTRPPASRSPRAEGHDCHALSFAYGQRHGAELPAAARVAAPSAPHRAPRGEHRPAAFGGSALTDTGIAVPEPAPTTASRSPTCRRATRCSCRFALAWAEVLGAHDIFIGVNAVDYSGYPDCRPEFIAAFERDGEPRDAGRRRGCEPLRIHAPLISLSKAEIIRRGVALGVDYSLTVSCYEPDERGGLRALRLVPAAAEGVRRGRRAGPDPLPVIGAAPIALCIARPLPSARAVSSVGRAAGF